MAILLAEEWDRLMVGQMVDEKETNLAAMSGTPKVVQKAVQLVIRLECVRAEK